MRETKCIVEHEGRKFESGGAVVEDDYLIAYPGERVDFAKLALGASNCMRPLNNWHGNRIGSWYVLSSRPAVFFGCPSAYGSTYYYMRGVVNGRRYSLRGFGVGMVATGKALKE